MQLPGGFSPTQALHTIADKANPFDGTDTDYDVFSNYSVAGGDRSPANGAFIGPQVQGASTTTPSGGTSTPVSTPTGGGTSNAALVAAAQAVAAANAKRAAYGATAAGYTGGARQSLTDVGNEYDAKNNAFVDDITQSQGGINTGLAQNELNLRRSMQNIVRGIQSGIRSGGVALAGMNASDSGAADALARAYAKVGNNQTGEARGEAATTFEDLQKQQGALNTKRNEGEGSLGTFRDTETGRVRNDFGSKLDLLNAQAEGDGVGEVQNRSVVDQILGDALARLSSIDQSRQQKLGGVNQWTPDDIIKEALRMDSLGAPGQAFSVTGPDVNYGGGQPSVGAPLVGTPVFAKGKDDPLVAPTRRPDQTF